MSKCSNSGAAKSLCSFWQLNSTKNRNLIHLHLDRIKIGRHHLIFRMIPKDTAYNDLQNA